MIQNKADIVKFCIEEFTIIGNVVFGYIFGSVAKGTAGPLSDLDVAIFVDSADKKEQEKIRENIRENLEEKLNLADKVDVVILNEEIPPLLESQVVYNGELIFSKDEAKRAHYEARAISRWLDWKFHQDKINKSIEKQFLTPVKPYGK
ncbi:MAG: nucleotidyltransferase domain-containing protein [bacterium]